MPSRKLKIAARAVPLTLHIMPGKQPLGETMATYSLEKRWN
ncbi:MAG: hypothetical protein WHU95_07120 [candidate division WOR-3 bacterium]|nr:hypothetical protein [candidate division WOR-3 bacterium]MDH7519445.1 hypothetical protein [bacterium]